ncbi:MAG: transcriptional repressor [Candidatus Nomurabacteria bacterium]|jgi:Fe2+ or Zn2+ uptake regulation protein|nr:transcriptional repressor [Candidatus Nomurabacteria bacterium]
MLENEWRFREELQNAGLRLTHNRRRIFEILEHTDRPLTIQQIAKILSDEVHFTSVYRSVETLTQARLLREIPHGFKNFYELGEKFRPHHHHVTCEQCGQSVAVDDARVESLMRELTIRAGLMPTRHNFEMFGVCRQCRRNN